jgi:hypothetical protein
MLRTATILEMRFFLARTENREAIAWATAWLAQHTQLTDNNEIREEEQIRPLRKQNIETVILTVTEA